MAEPDNGISDLRDAARELKAAIDLVRAEGTKTVPNTMVALPSTADSWNFKTFEIYINQRFSDMSLQLRERYEAQQTGVTAALAAAEKAVTAALIAAEKAVDKAEGAQQLRNEAQNEFRKSLSDLSGLMWTTKEGTASIDALRREITISLDTAQIRIGKLESSYSNIQGRMWAVSAMFAIAPWLIAFGAKFVTH